MLFGGLLITVFFGYSYFFGGGGGTGPLIAPSSPVAQSAGSDLLPILLNLKSLRLEGSVFDDPTFQSLENFGVEIPVEPLGRKNPFAPLPGGTGAKGPVISIGSIKK